MIMVSVMIVSAQICMVAAMHDRRSKQDVISLFLRLLDRSHPYTNGHATRVGSLAAAVGHQLGLRRSQCHELELAAILHDVGKVTVDEDVLDLPTRLNDEQMEHVRTHASAGADILSPISGFEKISWWILCHHERTDGRGYPRGLIGRAVPIESRIISVIDAYDAMTGGDAEHEKRNYRRSLSPGEAIAELHRCSGTQFDERAVRSLEDILSREGVLC
jgi:HD-GYP domain-containing protein (c-di-GMP phosphodiesterase class II)